MRSRLILTAVLFLLALPAMAQPAVPSYRTPVPVRYQAPVNNPQPQAAYRYYGIYGYGTSQGYATGTPRHSRGIPGYDSPRGNPHHRYPVLSGYETSPRRRARTRR